MNRDVVIVGGARTPFCEWQGGKRGDGAPGGLLKDISSEELGAIAIRGALEKTGTSPDANTPSFAFPFTRDARTLSDIKQTRAHGVHSSSSPPGTHEFNSTE